MRIGGRQAEMLMNKTFRPVCLIVTSGSGLSATHLYHLAVVLRFARTSAPLGCVGGGVLVADNSFRLGTFLTLDDVELHVIAFFQSFVSVQLNCRIVNEYIRSVLTSDESVAFGVIEPLDLPFVLGHRLLPSLGLAGMRYARGCTPLVDMTTK
jgi:hypothetical protein